MLYSKYVANGYLSIFLRLPRGEDWYRSTKFDVSAFEVKNEYVAAIFVCRSVGLSVVARVPLVVASVSCLGTGRMLPHVRILSVGLSVCRL